MQSTLQSALVYAIPKLLVNPITIKINHFPSSFFRINTEVFTLQIIVS